MAVADNISIGEFVRNCNVFENLCSSGVINKNYKLVKFVKKVTTIYSLGEV